MTVGSTIDFYDYSPEYITTLLRRGAVFQHGTRFTLYHLPGTGPVYDETGFHITGRSLVPTITSTCAGRQHFPCTVIRTPSLYRRPPCV